MNTKYKIRFDLHGIKGHDPACFSEYPTKEEADKAISDWKLNAQFYGGDAEIIEEPTCET